MEIWESILWKLADLDTERHVNEHNISRSQEAILTFKHQQKAVRIETLRLQGSSGRYGPEALSIGWSVSDSGSRLLAPSPFPPSPKRVTRWKHVKELMSATYSTYTNELVGGIGRTYCSSDGSQTI